MKNFFTSFKYAFAGIISSIKTERNFKVQSLSAALVLLFAFILKVDTIEWTILILCMILVLSLEMINSAIEKICDLIQPNQHPQIKIIKDVAAGAVLLASIGAAIIGAIILLPKLHILF